MRGMTLLPSPQPPIRTATPHDVPEIVALVESAYRGDSSRAGWTTEADLVDGRRTDIEGVASMVRTPQAQILLAGEPLVGCAYLERRDDDRAYFGMFAVKPSMQSGGIGRTLLDEAERIARDDWACAVMTMNVLTQREELIAWYLRRGYTVTGRRDPFPYGDERFGVPRRDDLAFEVLEKRLRIPPAPSTPA